MVEATLPGSMRCLSYLTSGSIYSLTKFSKNNLLQMPELPCDVEKDGKVVVTPANGAAPFTTTSVSFIHAHGLVKDDAALCSIMALDPPVPFNRKKKPNFGENAVEFFKDKRDKITKAAVKYFTSVAVNTPMNDLHYVPPVRVLQVTGATVDHGLCCTSYLSEKGYVTIKGKADEEFAPSSSSGQLRCWKAAQTEAQKKV